VGITNILKFVPFRDKESADVQVLETLAQDLPDKGQPPLMVMVSDASGLASFQLHSFSGVEDAEAFIHNWTRGRLDQGIIPFWAFTLPPDPETIDQPLTVEPIVLIRDAERPGVVYPFSFVDIDTAQSFVRHEAQRGMDLSQALIYWAVCARIEVDTAGSLRLIPGNPPAVARNDPVEAAERLIAAAFAEAQAAQQQATEVAENGDAGQALFAEEPIPFSETLDMTDWRTPELQPSGPGSASAPLEQLPPTEPPSANGHHETLEETRIIWPETPEAESAAPSVDPTAEIDREFEDEADVLTSVTGIEPSSELSLDDSPAHEDLLAQDLLVPTAAPAATSDTDTVRAVEEITAQPQPAEAVEPPQALVHEPAAEEATAGAAEQPFPERRASAARRKVRSPHPGIDVGVVATPNGRRKDDPMDLRIDIHMEVAKVLRVKRWKSREKPFRGFDSPAGRF